MQRAGDRVSGGVESCGGNELRSLSVAQLQRVGETTNRIRVRPPRTAALKVADCPDAQARSLRQLLLGQPRRPTAVTQAGPERGHVASHLRPLQLTVITWQVGMDAMPLTGMSGAATQDLTCPTANRTLQT
jgi:hypothetical protein